MKWPEPLMEAVFIRRYKRFFADCQLPNGDIVTAHCPNTGSMRTCLREGAPVWIAPNQNPRRKLKYTLYALYMPDGWVGVHTGLANKLVKDGIERGAIAGLQTHGLVQSEVVYAPGTRLDMTFKDDHDQTVWVEVKNTTLLQSPGRIAFPDAVTQRGRKHLLAMMDIVNTGQRAAMVYCVQRQGITCMNPSWKDDPAYAETLCQAHESGVELYAMGTSFTLQDISLNYPVDIDLGDCP